MVEFKIKDEDYNKLCLIAEKHNMDVFDYINRVIQSPIDMHDNKNKCWICNQSQYYPFSFTGRAVRFMMALEQVCRESDDGYAHYNEAKSNVRNIFGKEKEDFSGYATIGREPYMLIEKKTEAITLKNPDGDQKNSGRWRLTKKGKGFLSLEWKTNPNIQIVKVPKFTEFKKGGEIKLIGEKISIEEIEDLNYQEMIQKFKTYS